MTQRLIENAARLRAGAWALFGVMALVKIAVLLAPLSWRAEIVLSDALTYLLPMTVVIALGIRLGARDRDVTRSERVFWRMLSAAVASVFVSEVYWTWYAVTVDQKGPPIAAPVRVFHLVAVCLMFILLVRMTRFGLLTVLQRVRLYLDVIAAMVIAWPFVFAWWTFPSIGALPGGGVVGAAITALYPLFGGATMLVTGLIVFASAARDRPLWERLTAASLWLYGLSLCLGPFFVAMTLTTPVSGSGVLTTLFGFGFVLLLVAMVYRLSTSDRMSPEPWPLPSMFSARSLQYYPVATASAFPVLGWYAWRASGESVGGVLVGAVWALGLLLAARSWIAAVERARARVMASTDPATGVLTRALLDRRLIEVVEHSGETGREVSVIVFDVVITHHVGEIAARSSADEVAVAFARLVRAQLSQADPMFRVAGERFALVLEERGPVEAGEAALRVWVASGQDPDLAVASGAVSVFAGIASFPRHAFDAGPLLAAAEVAVSAAHGVEGKPIVMYDEKIAAVPASDHGRAERMRIQRTTVRALAEAVDARDPATRDHSTNVSELASALAGFLGLPDHQVQVVGLAALMHDVGKIGVRDDVLLRPGLLDSEGREEIEQHTLLGERILAPAKLDEILPGVRWHHERWDGTGYPDGLRGEDIPIEARILAVCDAFETMTTGRPYRSKLELEQALSELDACVGTQFDPTVAAAFIRMVRGLGSRAARDN